MSKQIESMHDAVSLSDEGNGHAPYFGKAARPWVRKAARVTVSVYCAQSLGFLFPAHAQEIAPSSRAPAGQRALVDAANNGVPIALIAPPSAAGVSRNQYDRFNVNANGLILNNSRNNTQTQLGGWVAGNPQLGATPARIILNEVVSGNASQLRGTMEVAGQRADIVIANPNGISCNGCGFLNAGRATLTTGTPQFGVNGNLNGFDVRQGQLSIGAQGLNAANLEQLDLVARGMVIEGEVWARNLNAIAGTNQVLYGTLQTVAQGRGEAGPAFAIDIKSVGGMYANQIYLIATEQGLGVNSSGRLAALQGNLVLSANGDLALKDSYAKADVRLESGGATQLKGQTISDEGKTTIASKGALTQQGEIDARQRLTISAAALSNSGTITQRGNDGASVNVAGDVRNAGTVFSGGKLDIHAGNIVDTGGKMLATGDLALQARSISLDRSEIVSDRNVNLSATQGSVTAAASSLAAGQDLGVTARDRADNAEGLWQAERNLILAASGMSNDNGTLLAGGELGIALRGTGSQGMLNNTQGTLAANEKLSISSGDLLNTEGTIATGGTMAVNTAGGRLENSDGQIVATQALALSTGALTNTGGTIASLDGTLHVDTGGKALRNEDGWLQAKGDVALLAGQTSNQRGVISGHDLALNVAGLNNKGGEIVATGKLAVQAADLDNRSGYFASEGMQTLAVSGTIDNRIDTAAGSQEGGRFVNKDGLAMMAASILNTDGEIASEGDVSIQAGSLADNGGGAIASGRELEIAVDGEYRHAGIVSAVEKLTIDAKSMQNNAGGLIASGNRLAITTADRYINAGTVSAAQGVRIQAGAGIANNGGGVIASGKELDVVAAGGYQNAGTLSAVERLTIDAASIVNDVQGVIASDNALAIGTQGGYRNAGMVSAGEKLAIRAKDVINDGSGVLVSGNELEVRADNEHRNAGTVSAAQKLAVQANRIVNDGMLSAGGNLTAQAGTLTNNGEISASATALNVSGTLTNNASGLIDGVTTGIQAATMNNTGRVYGDLLTVQSQTLNNTRTGVIAARDTLFVGGQFINNTDGGLIYSMGDLHMAGSLGTGQNPVGEVQQLLNASATIEAGRNMHLAVRNLTNRNDGLSVRTVTREVPVNRLYIQPDGSTVKYDAAVLGWVPGWKKGNGRYVLPSETYPFALFGIVAKDSAWDYDCTSDGDCVRVVRYQVGDPIWQLFNIPLDISDLDLTLPDLLRGCMLEDDSGAFRNMYGACGDYWRATDVANQRITTATQQLDIVINAFNVDVRNRSFEAWNEYSMTSETIEETVLESSDPGKILAGNALSIKGSGSIVNDNSNIVAGGAISIVGSSVINRSTEGTRKTTENGNVRHRRIEHHGGITPSYETQYTSWSPTTGAPVVSTFDLNAYVFKQNAAGVGTTPAPNAAVKHGTGPLAGTVAPVGTSGPAAGPIAAGFSSAAQVQSAGQTAMPALTVPAGSFFVIHPQPQALYLVETDPRFTQERNFLSSDYYLSQLNRDPERQLKRYGDGFIEQKLINDQILALTGRRYLSGYESTEAEYKGLMDAGIAFANAYQISPGVALSAEQMALLTTDIVLLVAQTVTLPDGRTEEVLVPQVYLRRPQAGDLAPSGALIAGSDIYIQTQGDLVNSGQIAASGQAALLAGNDLINQGGRINAQDIVARAQNDLRNVSGVIQGTGEGSTVALSAGRDIILETRTIASRTAASAATAASSRISVDRIATVQGGNVSIDAGRDLVGTGSAVRADQDLIATAGRDIKISAVEGSYQLDVATGGMLKGRTGFVHEQSVTNQLATMEAGNDLALVAGAGDVHLKGVDAAAGNSALIQGTNVTVEAARDSRTDDVQFVNKSGYWHAMQADEALAGGVISAGNALSVIATGVRDENGSPQANTGNVRLTGAYLGTEEGQLAVVANNDVRIDAITTEHKSANESYYKIKGMLGSRSEERSSFTDREQVNGSVLSGDSVLIKAGSQTTRTGDVTIQASQVVAGNDLQIHAGRDLSIVQAQETTETRSFYEQRASGMFSNGGLSVTFGKQQANQNHQGQRTSNVGSIVGSLEGDVILTAGNQYTQTASQVTALEGDIDIIARKVDINAATDSYTDVSEQRFKQSGLTLAITSPVISAIQTVQQMAEAAGNTKDGRMQALAGASAALAAKGGYDAIQKGQGITTPDGKTNQIATGKTLPDGSAEYRDATTAEKAGGINFSISIGGSKSESKTTQSGTQAVGSTVTAGGDVRIVAAGAGADSNVTIQGSNIAAGNNLLIAAENKLNLIAAQSTAEQHSDNKSSSGSLGISFGTDGFGVTASASQGRGNADGSDVTWTNTHVNAGNQLGLVSGGDANLIGAVASGKQVTADVGGNLNIESLQDTSQYDSKQKNVGGSITIGAGVSGSVSYSKSNIHSDYASVTEQSGIKAGDGGFQVNVQGNTDLKGAVIASTEQAVQDGSNSLVTASLTMSDIENKAEYEGKSVGVNVGTAVSLDGKLAPSGTSAGFGKDSDSASSTTQSGVSGIAGNKDVRSTDEETGIARIFDAERVQKEIETQKLITQKFNELAPKAAASYAVNQVAELRRQAELETNPEREAELKAEAEKWAPNGSYNIAMNIIIGAAGGNLESSVTKETLSWAANEMREFMIQDSKKFVGLCDPQGNCINNASGKSVGVNSDGFKLAGGRIVLADWCSNDRCVPDSSTRSGYQENLDGTVKFNPGLDAQGNQITVNKFMESNPQLSSPLGGHQGGTGQMDLFGIQFDYQSGSFWDKLAESFAGTHDMLNSFIWYDSIGNGKSLTGTPVGTVGNITNISNVGLAAPFALSVILPPEMWNAINALINK